MILVRTIRIKLEGIIKEKEELILIKRFQEELESNVCLMIFSQNMFKKVLKQLTCMMTKKFKMLFNCTKETQFQGNFILS